MEMGMQRQTWRTHSCVPRRQSCRRLALQNEDTSRRVSTRHARVRAPRCASILACLVFAAMAAAQTRYPSPDDLVISPDGTRLYAVLSGTGEVVAIDTAKRAIAGRVPVGKVPRGIAITPDGARLYVTNSWADTISEIDAATMQPLRTLPAGFEPTGIAFDGRGTLYVANRLSDDVAVVDLASGAITRRLISAHGASYAAASADGSRIFVTHIYPMLGQFRTPTRSEIAEIDAHTQIVTNRIALPDAAGVFHLTISRDGRLGLAALLRPRNLVPLAHVEHGWAFGDSLAVFGEEIGGVVQLPLDAIEDYFSLPFGVAIAPDKKRAYVSASGSNEVAVLDLARLVAAARSPSAARMANDLSAASRYVIARIPVGRNPRNIARSLDGATLWVANRLDDSISIIDTARMVVTGSIALGGPPTLTAERRGERLFYSSAVAFGNSFGCANCHLDSTFDGLNWDLEPDGFGIDIVDNRALEDIADTSPFKWNGQNPDLQTECGPRTERYFFRSQGFRGDDLEDLVSYIKAIPLRPNRYRAPDGELTPAQERGKAIFLRTNRKDGTPIPEGSQCFVCHSGKYYTNQLVADVGTGKPTDRSPLIDTPELTNVVNSAPYLHDGSAHTFEEIWTIFNPKDQHGVTNDLAKDELNDLIEYLKTL
jgi:YVTN family beta-propeller protein